MPGRCTIHDFRKLIYNVIYAFENKMACPKLILGVTTPFSTVYRMLKCSRPYTCSQISSCCWYITMLKSKSKYRYYALYTKRVLVHAHYTLITI